VNPLLESAKEFCCEHERCRLDGYLRAASQFDAKFVITKGPWAIRTKRFIRYHTFLGQKILEKYDQVFYADVDMRFVAPVGEEVFADGVVGTLHPGYINESGTPERRVESCAYINPAKNNKYSAAALMAGTRKPF